MIRSSIIFAFLLVSSTSLFAQKDLGNSAFELKMGQKVFETIVQTQGIYDNQALLNIVTEIGQNLEAQLEKDYDFKYFLVDVPEPNAFATAGGYVFVTRGILSLINTKDELAGILGHEFTHVTKHHTTKRIPPKLVSIMLELPGNVVGALTYKQIGSVINLPIELNSVISMDAYARHQESEADKLGAQLAAKAGYDPYGLIYGLENLESYVNAVAHPTHVSVIFQDHPLTENRVSELRELLAELGYKESGRTFGTSMVELHGVIYGQNPSAGILKKNAFIHPDLDLYLELPEKWLIQNSPSALVAVSKDKESTLVLSGVAMEGTAEDAAFAALEKIDRNTIKYSSDEQVNGMDAYKIAYRVKKKKQKDCLTEVMWIKIPTNGVLLKVVGVSAYASPNEKIKTTFASCRPLNEEDLENTMMAEVVLKKCHKTQTMDEFFERYGIKEEQRAKILLINAVENDTEIPAGRFIKTLDYHSLAKY